jgi:Flp pilus assembly protein TadD
MPSRKRRDRPSSEPLGEASQAALRDSSSERAREAGQGPANERRPTSVLFGLTLAGLLAASVFAVYWQARNFDFVLLDDGVYVSDNPNVQQGLSLRNLKWSCQFQDGNWIPLTWLSLMLDADLSGPSPRGYHITNVLLHVVNTLILFVLLTRATGEAVKSAIVAALFGLHPLHVESVAWITERKDVLSTLFGLASLWGYVEYAIRRSRTVTPLDSGTTGRLESRFDGRAIWLLTASFVCLAASLLSKATLVTLPFVFLLLDFWPLGRWNERWGRLVAEKTPFFLLTAVFSVIAALAQRGSHSVAALDAVSFPTRCANALAAYAAYLGHTVVPFHLAIYYPHPGELLSIGTVGLAVVVLAAISLFAVASRRRLPFVFVGWAWYLGTLVPMIGLVQIGTQQMADRYTYFPLIGIFIGVTWLIGALAVAQSIPERVAGWGAAGLLVALGSAAFVQASYWRDNVTLFRHAVESTGENPLAEGALGYALMLRGQGKEGIAHLESAAQLGPYDPQVRYVLALALQGAGRFDEAVVHYQRALALNDNHAEAHTNLAIILSQLHRYGEAKAHFLRALQINPQHAKACVNLGTLCLETKDYDDAIRYSEQALALDPRLQNCHWNLALAFRATGQFDKSISEFESYLAVAPADPDARRELARTRALMKSDHSAHGN